VALGEEGMFELDYLTQRLTFTRSNVDRPQLIGGYATTFTGDVAEIPVDNIEPLRAELDEFVRVLRTGERPYVDGEDGLWAVAIAIAFLTAASERRPIDLSDLPSRLAAI
jgi:predicted dehydrogenase